MNFLTTESTEHTEKEELDPLTGKIIGAAMEIHRALGHRSAHTLQLIKDKHV